MEREKLKSRLGFILISAGCAIGIGNVWKFPYMAGENGGGIFVLFYLIALLAMGVPALTVEFVLGRRAKTSPARLYHALEKPNQKWHLHSYVAVLGNYLLMMFYSVVAGWMLNYFVFTAGGTFEGLNSDGVAKVFDGMCQSPWEMTFYMGAVVLAGFLICSLGVRNGLEKVSKVMMIALLGIMILLAVNSLFTDSTGEGLKFYLMPNTHNLMEKGIVNVIVSAMNQAFFTLSIGMGSMAVFASFIGRERSLLGEAVNVALLDTFVAICSGLIIFPACFAYNVDVSSGPKLVFVTLPNIFNNMPYGRLWGSLFFVFMTFAAFSTVIAVFENIISCTMDMFSISRKKACWINCLLLFVLSLPCVLGFNLWSGFRPFGGSTTVQDLEDFIVSNLILPLGAICYILFATSRFGIGWKEFLEEANAGKGLKIANGMRIYMTYILPLIIFAIFLLGLINHFKGI